MSKTLTISIEEDLYKAMKDYKEESGVQLKHIVTEALEEKMKKLKKGK